MPLINEDETFMRRALQLAIHGEGRVEPNPMVGCTLVRDGQVIGEGYHHVFGGPHAEIDALSTLHSSDDARGATAYVTLEPCCHHGKTPPCSRALIDAGIQRVVVAMRDPFPKVNGGGIAQLRDAGIDVTIGVLQPEAESLNAPYLKRIRTGMPWVIAKWAMTLDGRIATVARDSQWITSPAARSEVHRLRGRVDAIAVGMGTVVDDDPMLTARPSDGSLPPRLAQRIVFCGHRLPTTESKLVRTANDVPLVLMVSNQIDQQQCDQLRRAGVVIITVDSNEPTTMAMQALQWMGRQSMTNVMLEGGSGLLASFFECDQIDECQVYIGAKVVGGREAPGPIGGAGVQRIADARRFRLMATDVLEGDLRAVYRRLASD
jgi:diaminohydroxyphosphoribosylaminopyrimidine deaminase/5-amino-6-(5-phosphoribosylamino)uracil reductase